MKLKSRWQTCCCSLCQASALIPFLTLVCYSQQGYNLNGMFSWATWKQVPSARANNEMAAQAMGPFGCGLPCRAAQPMRTRPAGRSLTALTQIGAVCGASDCRNLQACQEPIFEPHKIGGDMHTPLPS